MAQKNKKPPQKPFLERVVSWGVIGVFALLPLLYFPNRAASYVTSKQYFLIGMVDILTIFWVWLLLRDARYRLTKNNIFLLLPSFLLLVALTVSALAGVDPATSFFSIVESGTGLIVLYHIFLFCCITASVIRVQGKKCFVYITQAVFLASVVLAGMTFFTGLNGLFDIHSVMLDNHSGGATMGNVLLAGAYLIFSVFLTLYLITHEQTRWKKVLYWCGLAIVLTSPVYLNPDIFKGLSPFLAPNFFIGKARIATVSLIVGLLSSLFIWFCTGTNKKLWKAVGIIGITLMVLIGGVGLKMITTNGSPLQTFFLKESGNRVVDWHAAIEGIKERPLLGWGQENFHVVYQKYFDPVVLDFAHGNEAWALHPHSSGLEMLVNGGLVAMACYIAVLISLGWAIHRLRRKNTIDTTTFALLVGMLIAFILQQQMVYDSIVSYTMFFSIIAVVAGLSDQSTEGRQHFFANNKAYFLGATVIVVMLPLWYICAYLPSQKMNEFQTVASAHSDTRIAAYHHLFHSPGSYAITTDIEFYTSPLFYSYQSQREFIKNNAVYQKVAAQEIQALLTEVAPLWINRPYDYHLTLSLVQIANLQFYFTEDPVFLKSADIYAKRAFVLAPNDPQIYFAYAQTLVYEKDVPAAIALLDKSLSIAPQYQPAIDFKKNLQKL